MQTSPFSVVTPAGQFRYINDVPVFIDANQVHDYALGQLMGFCFAKGQEMGRAEGFFRGKEVGSTEGFAWGRQLGGDEGFEEGKETQRVQDVNYLNRLQRTVNALKRENTALKGTERIRHQAVLLPAKPALIQEESSATLCLDLSKLDLEQLARFIQSTKSNGLWPIALMYFLEQLVDSSEKKPMAFLQVYKKLYENQAQAFQALDFTLKGRGENLRKILIDGLNDDASDFPANLMRLQKALKDGNFESLSALTQDQVKRECDTVEKCLAAGQCVLANCLIDGAIRSYQPGAGQPSPIFDDIVHLMQSDQGLLLARDRLMQLLRKDPSLIPGSTHILELFTESIHQRRGNRFQEWFEFLLTKQSIPVKRDRACGSTQTTNCEKESEQKSPFQCLVDCWLEAPLMTQNLTFAARLPMIWPIVMKYAEPKERINILCAMMQYFCRKGRHFSMVRPYFKILIAEIKVNPHLIEFCNGVSLPRLRHFHSFHWDLLGLFVKSEANECAILNQEFLDATMGNPDIKRNFIINQEELNFASRALNVLFQGDVAKWDQLLILVSRERLCEIYSQSISQLLKNFTTSIPETFVETCQAAMRKEAVPTSAEEDLNLARYICRGAVIVAKELNKAWKNPLNRDHFFQLAKTRMMAAPKESGYLEDPFIVQEKKRLKAVFVECALNGLPETWTLFARNFKVLGFDDLAAKKEAGMSDQELKKNAKIYLQEQS